MSTSLSFTHVRRTLIAATLLASSVCQVAKAEVPAELQLLDAMAERAKTLADQPYQSPVRQDMPKALTELTYDQYRSINYRANAALWHNESLFETQFFYPGFIYREPVTVKSVTLDGTFTKVAFEPSSFDYYGQKVNVSAEAVKDIGFAGLRFHYPLNSQQYKDEFLVFQGASYFRLVGPGQFYGISARGLAVNTAESSGEEFPTYREFWLVKPSPTANHFIMYALLDSPSITGAFLFDIQPGSPTEIAVETRLFARKDITKVGIAPLTSMFLYGENKTRFYDDFRPEVHDSDGLLMLTHTNEWIWRPLTNNPHLQVTSLLDENPRGFGLAQRDRTFSNYLDVEAHYHKRPSLWIQPLDDWGKGRVELVEIPTDSETNDNIVSYWVPENPIKAKDALRFRYKLSTFNDQVPQQTTAYTLRTRIGWAATPGETNPPPISKRLFVVDFTGGPLQNLPGSANVRPELQVNKGVASDVIVSQLPETNTWRVMFKLTPEGDTPVDMRLFLHLNNQRLSEVWNYVWSPNAVK